jgi:DNA polymerase III epsilon subunit-like protein
MDTERPVIGISLDIEATGPNIKKHAIIELGAVAMVLQTRTVLEKLSIELTIPPKTGWDDRTVREFWDNKEIEEHAVLAAKKTRAEEGKGTDPATAMQQFVEWVENVHKQHAGGDATLIRFLTDTTSFDATFINYYLAKYTTAPPLHMFFGSYEDVVCTISYARGLGVLTHEDCNRSKRQLGGMYDTDALCREALKIPPDVKPLAQHNHTAVNDAQYMAEEHAIQLYHAHAMKMRH